MRVIGRIAILQKVMNHVSLPKRKPCTCFFEASTFDVNLKKKDSKKKKIRVILFYSKKKDLVIIRLVGGMGLAFLV